MPKYLIYDIEAIQDLKFAKTNIQMESEETMEYITGSAIRGAFIYRYIKENNVSDINQGIHKDKLLKGKIKFLNAYPACGKERSIPFPKCYFAPKEEIRGFDNSKDRSLRIKLGLDRNLGQGFEKVRLSEFVGYGSEGFKKVKVDKISSLHINKQGAKNILFRYESIKRGQNFKGIIIVEDDNYIDDVINLFNDSIVYLGGSKGSGYGKCRIKNLKLADSNPETNIIKGKENIGNEIYLVAMSDIIYRNNFGEYKTNIDADYICSELDLNKVKFIDSSIETKNITNFNNKWNCHSPQIIGIKAGSVFKYKIDGEIDKDKLNKFVNNGIGERKIDGYGRFIIVNTLEDSYIVNNSYEVENHLEIKNSINKLNEEERKQLDLILNKIYKRRIEKDINRVVIDLDKNMDKQSNLNNNQWGNFKGLFSYLSYQEPNIGIEKYNKYINHIRRKRSISYKQLQRVRYKDELFIDFLNKYISESTDLELFHKRLKIDTVSLGGIETKIDESQVYKYNMKILEELCRYNIRKEVEE